jgi:two-component system, OmpR family, response regulator RegX3
MLPPTYQPVILAFAANAAFTRAVDFSTLPIPVQWFSDVPEMICEARASNPFALIVLGDGDNIAAMRVCYALRQSSPATLHLISSTMSESEANLARALGATTVQNADAASLAIGQSVSQFLEPSWEQRGTDTPKHLEIAGLHIDLGRRTVSIRGTSIALTRIEFELLALLVKAAGSVISRADLVAKVWGSNWFGVDNVLDTHLAHLRRKIAGSGLDKAIVNVRGVGFYFEPDRAFASASTAR